MSDAPLVVADSVHYVSYGTPGGEYSSMCRAATVAEVGGWLSVATTEHGTVEGLPNRTRTRLEEYHEDACGLVVLNPTGVFFKTVQYRTIDGGPPVAGTWHHVHECPSARGRGAA
jgi:hypothetical protein